MTALVTPEASMVERAARALYAEAPCQYDVGYEASPDRALYDKAALAALTAALSVPVME